jgi:apoptotic chromatin condensation inducer in the nucleus
LWYQNINFHFNHSFQDSHIELQTEKEPEKMDDDSSLQIENRRSSVHEHEQSKPEKSTAEEYNVAERQSSRSPRKDSYHRRDERRSSEKNRESDKEKSEVKSAKEDEEQHVPKEKPSKEVDPKKPIQRKRKWLSRKPSDTKPSVITISTDSLKNIISDVRPVPLADVRLESSSEDNEDVISIEPEGPRLKEKSSSKSSERDSRMLLEEDEPKPQRPDRKASATRLEKQISVEQPVAPVVPSSRNRKVSIVELDAIANKVQRPPSPAKRSFSNILYITNLVRPFTVLQLKGLLARTGKIVENGFWIDKIKSKCFVKYETEE